jgi:glycosyltransferase involved in cell wall biosynthesis
LKNVVLVARALNDTEFCRLQSCSNAVILPYRSVTGSGALLAAWTLGTPVIASDLVFFREMSEGNEGALHLFRTGDAQSLGSVILKLCKDTSGDCKAAAVRAGRKYQWKDCLREYVAALDCMPRKD